MPLIILFGLILAIILLWLARRQFRRVRQEKLFETPLQATWISILDKNVALYAKLPQTLRNKLHGYINVFLDEKKFIGRGIEITDEIRITVAGNACLLLLQGRERTFPGFTSILIYPDIYIANDVQQDGFLITNKKSARAGESWIRGPMVLSWKEVTLGSLNAEDGHNVVIHEFAHKLDEQSGVMDGLPVLRNNSHYAEWTAVLREEYGALQERAKRGKNKVLDRYGTVSPPEFFAVATESFFEKPIQMKKRLPELYKQLATFYNLDPASWHGD